MRLYPTFSNRDFTARLSQPDIAFSVEGFSHQAIGGPESCTIKAAGSLNALWELVEILRCPVEVYDERGECVWWGFVNTVEIATGTYQYGVSLDSMANKIKVIYTPTGTATRLDTEWASDADSIAEYGYKELQVSTADITTEQALNARDTALTQRRYPVPVVALAGADAALATITCRGWWDTLDWQYYRYVDAPIIDNPPAGGSAVVLGYRRQTGTLRLAYWPGGWQEINGNWYLYQSEYYAYDTTGETATRLLADTGSAMRFSLAGVVPATRWLSSYIRDYSSHYDRGWVQARVALDVKYAGISAAGYPQGGPALATWDSPHSVRCRFHVVVGMTVRWVKLWTSTLGAPSDSLIIDLLADNAGVMGSLIASITSNAVGRARTYHFSGPVTLATNTYYWLRVRHSATGTGTTNLYDVGLGGQGAGDVDFGTGATFPINGIAFSFDDSAVADIQLESIRSASMQFVSAIRFEASVAVGMPQNVDGDFTTRQILRQIVDTNTAQRILMTVDQARRLRIYDEPAAGSADYRLASNGDVLDPYGNRVEPHRVVAGVWARLADVIPASADISKLASAERFFVERVEYAAGIAVLYPRVARDPFDFSGIEVG